MSLINKNDTWLILFVVIGTVALGVWLEKKYKWAAKLSAVVIILFLAIIFSNINLIPTESGVYDFVWDYCLPLSLPLLLFKSDIRKICKESGQLLLAYFIGAIGTVVGTLVSYVIFKNSINELAGISAMMTGTYIGGSVNFAVLASNFNVSGSSISAATIADNLNMAIYFVILLAIPVKAGAGKGVYEAKKSEKKHNELTLKNLVTGMAISAFVVAISDFAAKFFVRIMPTSNGVFESISALCGNRYLWITTFSVVVATLFAKKLEELEELQEVGIFFIYCFMFVIGAPASIEEIVKNSPLLFLFALIIVAFNMLFTFGIGSILRIDRKTLIIASNANVGGPTTAASMAITKGWDDLVGLALLVGCLGYVVGNYFGLIIGNMLMQLQ